MWLLYVSIKKYVQTYSLVWSFLTPVRRFECLNLNPRGRSAILAAFSPLQRSHMRRRLTAVFIGIHEEADGRTDVRTDVDDVMAIKPNFLTSMGYHIFLTMVLRARAELRYELR